MSKNYCNSGLSKGLLWVFLFGLIVSSSACVYRQDVHQGNRINQQKLDQLAHGMTKSQVQFLLGKPAIIDPFHQSRWVYIYFLKDGDEQEIDQSRMILEFEQDRLTHIEGNIKAAENLSDPTAR